MGGLNTPPFLDVPKAPQAEEREADSLPVLDVMLPAPSSDQPPSDPADPAGSVGAPSTIGAPSAAEAEVDRVVAVGHAAAWDLATGSAAAELAGSQGTEAEGTEAESTEAEGTQGPPAGTGATSVGIPTAGEPVLVDATDLASSAPIGSASIDVPSADQRRGEAAALESDGGTGGGSAGTGRASLEAKPGRPRTGPRSLNNTLTSTIRRWAKPTTPKELEARGVKRVRSVSMSRIAALIEKAINRELIARTLDGDTDDALSLSANAREGFLELARSEMSGHVDVSADSSAFADLDRLREELEARRAELEEKGRSLGGADVGVEDEALERRLRAVFASRPASGDPGLERDVVQAALEELSQMRGRAAERRLAEGRRETRQLERRITKLAGLLEQTEGELRRTRARGTADTGVASMFAEVQGLDAGDNRLEQKQDLMQCIFEANLELRR